MHEYLCVEDGIVAYQLKCEYVCTCECIHRQIHEHEHAYTNTEVCICMYPEYVHTHEFMNIYTDILKSVCIRVYLH
jgi:hypothetical protein